MGRPTRMVAILVAATLIGLAPRSAHVQTAERGVLNAVSFRPVTRDTAILVRVLDNSDDNLAIKTAFEEALAEDGYRIANSASPLVMSLESREQLGGLDGSRRTWLKLQYETSEEKRYIVNLYDSKDGALLNRGVNDPGGVSQSEYELKASIENRTTGKTLWQGRTVAVLRPGMISELGTAMAPVLVDHIDRTVKAQPFDIQ